MPSISIKNLVKTYPTDFGQMAKTIGGAILGRKSIRLITGNAAVDNITLSISSGERIGIIGRNGAGKSTLLHMIAGIADPTSGKLNIDGHVTSVLTLGIGLRDELTGRENIYLDGEVQGKSREQITLIIEHIINFADLGEFIDRPVRTYSTGMKSRLAFSMISSIDPEILLIDEALSVGDAVFAEKATKRIREICARGKIVIVVSHSMKAIVEICNRCIWMQDGKIKMDGNPQSVTEAYLKFIRDQDELELVKKFRDQSRAESIRPGYEVSSLEIYTGDDDKPRAVFSVAKPWKALIKGICPDMSGKCKLHLSIERLDGLRLLENESWVQGLTKESGGHEFKAEVYFEPWLSHGIYRIEIQILQENGDLLARRSSVFELTTDNLPDGGRPALICPYEVSTEFMDINNDNGI